MIRAVSVSGIREREKAVMEGGLGSLLLMERAASFAAESILSELSRKEKEEKKPLSAVLLCGSGNNGGDGLALARILYEKGLSVRVLLIGEESRATAENKQQLTLLQRIADQEGDRVRITRFAEASFKGAAAEPFLCADLYVDALLGIGQSRPLGGDYAAAVRFYNERAGLKAALDIPTGIDADTGRILTEDGLFAKADITLCFGALKTGLLLPGGRSAAGCILTDTCGIFYPKDPMPCFCPEEEDLAKLLLRDADGNKGDFGKLLFVCGSKDTPGAAILSVKGAFKSGAGYIRARTDEEAAGALLAAVPETVLVSGAGLEAAVRASEVIAAGCGLGKTGQAKEKLSALLEALRKNREDTGDEKILILDADALNLLSEDEGLWKALGSCGARAVLTPHMAEFSRLCKKSVDQIRGDRLAICLEFASQKNVILVLKDSVTVCVSPDGRCAANTSGNDGMAVAGSGDVLCGILAAMAGRGKDLLEAAAAGVYLHGLAGDAAAARLGKNSMTPSDLLEALPEVLKEITAGEAE